MSRFGCLPVIGVLLLLLLLDQCITSWQLTTRSRVPASRVPAPPPAIEPTPAPRPPRRP